MPLSDSYPLGVTFIASPARQNDGTTKIEPIGTGFIVNVPTRVEGLSFEYVVTASHVVSGDRETYARIRTKDGGSKDLRAAEWIHHPNADVAASLFRPEGHDDLNLLHLPDAAMKWTLVRDWRPDLGDRVYFLGLLALPAARGVAERNVPMVRSGTIGALYQDDVPHRWPDGSIRKFQMHLIDCRSYSGFSGSPCFFQRDDQVTGVRAGVQTRGQVTFLFGLISGHFDTDEPDEPEGPVSKVNTGVGLVTPAERIVEVLQMEELKEEREQVARKRKERPEEGATLDSVAEEREFGVPRS